MQSEKAAIACSSLMYRRNSFLFAFGSFSLIIKPLPPESGLKLAAKHSSQSQRGRKLTSAGSTCLGFHKVFSKYEVDDVNKLLTA